MDGKPLVSNTIMQSLDLNGTASVLNSQQLVAGVYGRVSTGRQEDEQTIDSQIDEIILRVKQDGHILPKENIFKDDGWTGEMLQRPGLDAMLEAAKEGRFQVLYVYDRGRISRVFAYQEIIIEELLNKDIKFVTLHDVKAETAEERVLQAMQGVFHEYERVKIAERMRRGKMYKAKSGLLINGNSIDGFDYIKKTDKEPTHYVINEERAKAIRLIFQWFCVERVSIREIMKRLYDLGMPPRKGKSEFWTKGPIERILKCESYFTGIVYYNKSEAIVAKNPIKKEKYKKIKRTSRRKRPKDEWIPYKAAPILIEDYSLFEKAQEILSFNQKYARKNRKYEYLLSGLVYCGCGNKRAGDGYSKGGNHYYRCAERIYKYPLEGKCKLPGVSALVLDKQFWDELSKLFNDPDLLWKQIVEWFAIQNNHSQDIAEKKRIDEALEKLNEEEKRYAKAYGSGALEFEQFTDLMRDVKKRRKALEAQGEAITQDSTIRQINEIPKENVLEEIIKIAESIKTANKRQVIQDIIDKITIKERREVEVWGSLSFPTLNMAYGTINRNSRTSQRRKINPFQCPAQKAGRLCCQLPIRHHRTQCGCCGSAG